MSIEKGTIMSKNFGNLMRVRRGEIYYADLGSGEGSEQNGIRPVVVIQNDIGNRYSPTVIVAVLTSKINKAKLPTHVDIDGEDYNMRSSVILLEQIRTIDKKRLKERICSLEPKDISRINNSLLTSLAL